MSAQVVRGPWTGQSYPRITQSAWYFLVHFRAMNNLPAPRKCTVTPIITHAIRYRG